ncbi:MAG: sulfite exporter TauE/SafE family protein [Hyphomonadaceae bacterium]
MSPDQIAQWAVIGLALAAAGLTAGFVGGLFGIGGGIVIVPALYYGFSLFDVPDEVRMHAAVATSLATIMATSWRSLATHAKAGAVDFETLRAWAPWIALGATLGAIIAGLISETALLIVFGVGIMLVSANLTFGREEWRLADHPPKGGLRGVLASALGAASSMMGIGGGVFGVSIMTLCGRTIHQAVATASGFGAAIAIPGTLANIATGWNREGLPAFSLGYVHAPSFVFISLMTMLTAPYGARFAHSLSRRTLRRILAAFLALTAANMLREAFFS